MCLVTLISLFALFDGINVNAQVPFDRIVSFPSWHHFYYDSKIPNIYGELSNIDEDISFESFVYEDAQPTPMQKFFLTHKEINIAEFARSIGMNATLLRNYINGFKKPSAEREKTILEHIHQLGQELMAANF